MQPSPPRPHPAPSRVRLAAALLASSLALPAAAPDWRDASLPPETRVAALLPELTLDQKIDLVLAKSDEDHRSLAPFGIPPLSRVDASCGLRGDQGVTAFPVPIALAATFDTGIAAEYGAAIAKEARAKRWNVILGPTVDVARGARGGRVAESFGEDPLVNALFGQSVAAAMQRGNTIAMVKHFTAYNQEADRLSHNITVSDRTLREIYDLPFEHIVAEGGADSFMTSYPKINGLFACENPAVLGVLKRNLAFKGYLATDYEAGSDIVAQLNAGIDSASLQTRPIDRAAFSDGRVPRERLDDAARRILHALFKNGLYDHPLPAQPAAIASTPAHRALAVRVAEASTVLLKNSGRLLPLRDVKSIAVIGPAGRDMIAGVQGSSYVEPGGFVTAIEAIHAQAGPDVAVTHAQGSLGDVDLPLLKGTHLRAPDGRPGLLAEYFESETPSGQPAWTEIVSHVELRAKPARLQSKRWSVRFRGQLVPTQTGLARFSAYCGGSVVVSLGGDVVINGSRAEAHFFAGPGGPHVYALHGVHRIEAGVALPLEVSYSTKGSLWGQAIVLGWQPESLIPAAAEAARRADVAIVFVNLVSGEEMDRADLSLPGDQDALVEAVAAVNPRTIVVLNTPGPVLMPWLGRVPAVLQAWYPGSAGGEGLARVLFGLADPGGRLPVTFPAGEDDGPAFYQGGGKIAYDEGVFVGYRHWLRHDQRPLFPFGHGISYADTTFSSLRVGPLAAGADHAEATVVVKNTSGRAGEEVVQLYTGRLPTDAVETPALRLAGFAKVPLAPGEEKTVAIRIPRKLASFWDERAGAWSTPRGEVPVHAGRSVADLRLSGALRVE